MTKKEIYLSISLGVLFFISLMGLFKLKDVEGKLQSLDNMQHQFQMLDGSVQSISSQVHMNMDRFLQEQLWIPNKGYEVTDIDLERNSIDVLFEWSMRDLSESEKLSFLYREENENDWTVLEVQNHNGLNYSIQHTFPLRGNYETQIVATSPVGKRSEELLPMRFNEQLTSRILIDAYLHSGGPGVFDFDISLHNQLEHEFMLSKNKEDLKIKSAKALIYVDGKQVKQWDLFENKQDYMSDQYSESINYHNYIQLKDEYGENPDVELRVIVEDGLGLEYEKVAEGMY